MKRKGDHFISNYFLTILCVIAGLMIIGKIGSIFSKPSSFSSYSSSSKYSTSRYSRSRYLGGSGGSGYSGNSTTTYEFTLKPTYKPYSSSSSSHSSSKVKPERTVDPMDHDIESYYLDY